MNALALSLSLPPSLTDEVEPASTSPQPVTKPAAGTPSNQSKPQAAHDEAAQESVAPAFCDQPGQNSAHGLQHLSHIMFWGAKQEQLWGFAVEIRTQHSSSTRSGTAPNTLELAV